MIINIKFCFPRLRIHKEAKKKISANRKFRILKITILESIIGVVLWKMGWLEFIMSTIDTEFGK